MFTSEATAGLDGGGKVLEFPFHRDLVHFEASAMGHRFSNRREIRCGCCEEATVRHK